MPEVEIMGMTVTPRTKRDQIMFLLLSAHMNGFEAASLEKWQPAMNQTIHFLQIEKFIERAGGSRWKLTELGLSALQSRYKPLFNLSEFRH